MRKLSIFAVGIVVYLATTAATAQDIELTMENGEVRRITMDMIMSTLPEDGAAPAVPGPYEVISEGAFNSAGHILFRPAKLESFPEQDTLPVLVWGNGGCNLDPARYREFLHTIASHGFLVITTAPSEGESRRANADDLLTAINWAETENRRSGSPLRGRIDTTHVAAMGQSCGGLLAISLGADPRVQTTGVFNSGISPGTAAARSDFIPVLSREDLTRLHGPVMFINGHERDFMMSFSYASFQSVNHVPAFYGARHHAGHTATIPHPGGGEFANVASNWLRYYFKGDKQAGRMFTGEDCELCTNPDWDAESKGLHQE